MIALKNPLTPGYLKADGFTHLRHRKFGVCDFFGRSTVVGVECLSLLFANGMVHFPLARSEELLADLSPAERSAPLDGIGLDYPQAHARKGKQNDSILPRIDDTDSVRDLDETLAEILA